jgi:hypothetical protein
MVETWKPIEGMPQYEISTFGRVKSKKRRMEKILNSKHMQVMLYDEGYKMHRIHRLVAQAFIPNPDNLPDVRHIDGDPSNNMVGNLEWFNQQLYRKQNVSLVPTPEQIKKLQAKYKFKILE